MQEPGGSGGTRRNQVEPVGARTDQEYHGGTRKNQRKREDPVGTSKNLLELVSYKLEEDSGKAWMIAEEPQGTSMIL